MLLKLVFFLYFLLYFVNGLTTHTRYSDKENVMDSMNKQKGNHQNASNSQDVIVPKNTQPNKNVSKSKDKKLSDKQPSNDIDKLDQNLTNIKEANDKQPNPNTDFKGSNNTHNGKQLNKNQGLPNSQQLPDSKEPNKNPNNIQSNGQKAHGREETTNKQSKKSQSQISGQKTLGANELTNNQSNKNQIQVSSQKIPGANEPTNKQSNKNQIQESRQKIPGSNEPTNKQSNTNQSQVGIQKTPGANEPINMQSNKNLSRGSGGQKLPDVKEPTKNQGKPSVPKLTDVNQPSKNEGKPGNQKLPDVKEPTKNQGKPSVPKLTDVNQPSKNEGKPGNQKLPDVKKPSKNQERPSGQKLPGVKEPSKNQDMALLNDSCPSNKSLHSRNDIIVMINYVYKQLSVDENIREAYQSHAMSLRDKHFKELNKFNTWFHNQPEHLEHVLQSLGNVRKQLIEPKVKKIAKLLHDNLDMDEVIEIKKERLRFLTKKLNRYERLCSLNCEEGEERFVVKRNVQDDYFCSSIEDLYNKINTRLSEFVQRFNNESNNRFAKDNDIYHKKIENIKNKLKDKGLQMFGRTLYDILHLQDEYHHYVEHLNISSLEKEINLAKNLSIQVEAKLLELNEQIEKYGQHCRSCARWPSRRNIREAMTKMDSKQVRKNSETLVDLLIDNKFNETALRVHNDWDAIFKDLNQLITKTEKENPELGMFKSIQTKVIKMTSKERKVLNKLKSTTSDIGIQKAIDWVKILRNLLEIIKEVIIYILKLNNAH